MHACYPLVNLSRFFTVLSVTPQMQLVHRETLLTEAQQQLEAARGIQAITHHSGSGGAPPGLMAIGSSRSSSIPGGLSAGLSSSVSLPIGAMSSAFHSTAGLGGGGGGGGGGSGGNGTRLAPLPPPEPKEVWGSVSPMLAAVGARSHLPAAGGLNGCNGPNIYNGIAANGQAAAPVVPSLIMVNGFSKVGGGGGTGAAGGATLGRGGPGAGAGALTPQAMEAAKSLGLSSAYSEDFSGSEPGDAEECE